MNVTDMQKTVEWSEKRPLFSRVAILIVKHVDRKSLLFSVPSGKMVEAQKNSLQRTSN